MRAMQIINNSTMSNDECVVLSTSKHNFIFLKKYLQHMYNSNDDDVKNLQISADKCNGRWECFGMVGTFKFISLITA